MAAILVFALLVHQLGSKRAVEVYLTRAWSWIRPCLLERYPTHAGLLPGSRAPTRHDHRRYAKRHGLFGERLSEAFEDLTAEIVRRVEPSETPLGTRSVPHVADVLCGDGTVITPLYRGDGKPTVIPETGEVVVKRFDPDARPARTGDGRIVSGTNFVVASRYLGESSSLLIMGIRPAGPGGEAATGVEVTERISANHPSITAVAYDKAARGMHLDRWYKQGILPLVRPIERPTNGNSTPFIETAQSRATSGPGGVCCRFG